MNSIADSDAYFNPERMLVQHQAALTLLQGMLANPAQGELQWLDVACGRGQIIAHLKDVLSDNHRQKIHYFGYDIDNAHSRIAKQTAEGLSLGAVNFEIGNLSRFHETVPQGQTFDFITLTNTVHEIHPTNLAEIIFNCVSRLSSDGCFFVYDMDQLPSAELGAVLWSASEIKSIVATMCAALGAGKYEPAVGQWQHRSCNGWNIQIQRPHLQIEADISGLKTDVVSATAKRIQDLVVEKIKQTKSALESLTQYGAETGDEASAKEAYLYDYWALTRALEAGK